MPGTFLCILTVRLQSVDSHGPTTVPSVTPLRSSPVRLKEADVRHTVGDTDGVPGFVSDTGRGMRSGPSGRSLIVVTPVGCPFRVRGWRGGIRDLSFLEDLLDTVLAPEGARNTPVVATRLVRPSSPRTSVVPDTLSLSTRLSLYPQFLPSRRRKVDPRFLLLLTQYWVEWKHPSQSRRRLVCGLLPCRGLPLPRPRGTSGTPW